MLLASEIVVVGLSSRGLSSSRCWLTGRHDPGDVDGAGGAGRGQARGVKFLGAKEGEPGLAEQTDDHGDRVPPLHVRFPSHAMVPSDGDESGLEAASRVPAGDANDGDFRSGDALDARPRRGPWRSIGDHVEDEVPGRPQAVMKAAKRSQQILAGERIVQRVEVAGDEIDRLGELERPEVLKQEAMRRSLGSW